MNININNFYHYNFFVIGMGGTGSQFLPFLYQLLNGIIIKNPLKHAHIMLIDGDTIEEKNTINQKFLTEEVGMPKATVLASRYSSLYSNINTSYIDSFLDSSDTIYHIINENKKELGKYISMQTLNVIIGCVDNDNARCLLNDTFSLLKEVSNIIYIDSGNGTSNRCGQVIIGVDVPGCYIPPIGELYPEIYNTKEEDTSASCTRIINENPQNIATNITAAVTILNVINNILIDGTVNFNEVKFDCPTLFSSIRRKK